MKKVTVVYGSDSRSISVLSGANIGSIVSDSTTKVILGYGDNVKALIGGIEQPFDAVPSDGATITLETVANKKAN